MLYRLSHRFSVDFAGRRVKPTGIAEASAHYRVGRRDQAADACRAILAQDPRHFEALHLLGVICTEQDQPDQALTWLTAAERENSDVARLQYHLGNALMALERHAEAEARFRLAVRLDPDLVDAHNNLGTTLRAQNREAEAEDCYCRVLARRPDYPPAHYNLGLIQAKRGDLEAAVSSFRSALAGPPGSAPADKLAEVHDPLAQTLMELLHCEDALQVCRARCALQPDDPRGEWHESLALLTLGRYAEGWPKYERRWELPGFRSEAEASSPLPRAPALHELVGKRVLLRAEQGRGDAIQFVRYASPVAKYAASVTLVVPADLLELMQTVPGVDAVIDDGASEPEHDIAAALMSLPLTFGTDIGTIPRDVPYLHAPAERVARWRQHLSPRTRPRVGLCWRGSQHISERSLPLGDLAPLLAAGHVEFHAVQTDIPAADRTLLQTQPGVMLHDGMLTDFADTAALLSLMDLVVTIDTGVAHLAGALARPTWIMLRRSPDWRWLLGRDDSPWYPTVRLFRQDRRGGWPPVLVAVRAALDRHFGS
ncbi:MAG TPA: tetratricopeptide repeat-containing glycosyltransferase family protein [Acetobacteraceae bacterium]|nr:tetratricopeptide repeat-containing glycosyltransferase family protein [Acetobacteraceae bacterium]